MLHAVRVSIEKIEDDFITPSEWEFQVDVGEKTESEMLECLETFKGFDHPYDGQFLPKVYLKTGELVFVVVAESGQLSCTNANDPNQSFVNISPREIVNLIFDREVIPDREDEVVVEEKVVKPEGVYWLSVFVASVCLLVFSMFLMMSWKLYSEEDALSESIVDYSPVRDATKLILMRRHTRGIFYSGRWEGSELISIERRAKVSFYLFQYSEEHHAVVPVLIEKRSFEYAKIGSQLVLNVKGVGPIYYHSKNKIQYFNVHLKKYEGALDDFFEEPSLEVVEAIDELL